jgi:hypothetical protein
LDEITWQLKGACEEMFKGSAGSFAVQNKVINRGLF